MTTPATPAGTPATELDGRRPAQMRTVIAVLAETRERRLDRRSPRGAPPGCA